VLKLKAAWVRGDREALNQTLLEPFKKDYPMIYHDLVIKRNKAWVPKIEKMVLSNEVELILVGALHLVGEDSILSQLAAKGYKVEML